MVEKLSTRLEGGEWRIEAAEVGVEEKWGCCWNVLDS